MDVTLAERTVLRQVRELFGEASVTSYRFASFAARWPTDQRQIYQLAFDGLVKKGLLTKSKDEQMFGVTSAGLRAMV
jgi:hypothetical protein